MRGNEGQLRYRSDEAADVLLILFHLAHREGFDLMDEATKKFEINQARAWGKPDDRGVRHHIPAMELPKSISLRFTGNGWTEIDTQDMGNGSLMELIGAARRQYYKQFGYLPDRIKLTKAQLARIGRENFLEIYNQDEKSSEILRIKPPLDPMTLEFVYGMKVEVVEDGV